jgi:hypothetical protein
MPELTDENAWDYESYCAFITSEGLIPLGRADWLAFNRAVDSTSALVSPSQGRN